MSDRSTGKGTPRHPGGRGGAGPRRNGTDRRDAEEGPPRGRFPEDASFAGERRRRARSEMWMRRRVLDALRDGPKTVPEVARFLGIRPEEAMWWMMGYVRYGYVVPTGEVAGGGYHTYRIAEVREP